MNRIVNSSLSQAIYDDNFDNVQFLINVGKRLDIQDNLGWTSLHAAVSKNRVNMVEFIASQPEAPLNIRCYEGQTPLYLACQEKCDPRIVSALLIAGADPNVPNNEDISPLHMVDDPQAAETLLTFGANINAQDFNKYTPLHCAIERDNLELVDIFIAAGADTSLRECNGLNPFMTTFQGHYECAEKLIGITEDLDAVAEDGWSALMLAINAGKLNIAYDLIKRGADVNITTQNLSPLHLAVMRQEVQLFDTIWEKIDFKTIKKSHSLPHLMLIHRWYVPERLESFFKVLDTPVLYTTVAYQQNFLGFLFRFELDNKLELVICEIVARILNATRSVNSVELVSFIENFYLCKYKFQLLDILNAKGRADFDQSSLILLATEFDPELVPKLLTISITTNPIQVFRCLTTISRNDLQVLKLAYFILSFCTPVNLYRSKYLTMLKNYDVYNLQMITYTLKGVAVVERVIEILKVVEYTIAPEEKAMMCSLHDKVCAILSINSPPTLKELSRDAVRTYLKCRFGKMKNCDNVLSRLCLPNDILDIIKLKLPVNNHL